MRFSTTIRIMMTFRALYECQRQMSKTVNKLKRITLKEMFPRMFVPGLKIIMSKKQDANEKRYCSCMLCSKSIVELDTISVVR